MADQWPAPRFRTGGTENIVDLTNQFDSYYRDVFMYTLKNPTATAPAHYVMDMLFHANKIIKLTKRGVPGGSSSSITPVQNDFSEGETGDMVQSSVQTVPDEEKLVHDYKNNPDELDSEDDDSDWAPDESDEESDDNFYEYNEGSGGESDGKSEEEDEPQEHVVKDVVAKDSPVE